MSSLPAPGPGETHRGALLPWGTATVAGPSMLPGLRPGDRLLVRYGAPPRAGDVVVARFDDVAGAVVKRCGAVHPDGRVEAVSDNPYAGGDSRAHGPARPLGRVVAVRRGWRLLRAPQAP